MRDTSLCVRTIRIQHIDQNFDLLCAQMNASKQSANDSKTCDCTILHSSICSNVTPCFGPDNFCCVSLYFRLLKQKQVVMVGQIFIQNYDFQTWHKSYERNTLQNPTNKLPTLRNSAPRYAHPYKVQAMPDGSPRKPNRNNLHTLNFMCATKMVFCPTVSSPLEGSSS